MIFIPGLFFGTALILRGRAELSTLIWILLAVGALMTVALVLSFTTVIISEEEIGIKNLKKSQVINKTDIVKQQRKTSFRKGLESIVWKLHLKNGNTVTISSDLFKEPDRLKESLNWFLKDIPKK
ncbi:hypothetical protein [Ekhidna sp.]|uniref:hypothetical protein n=1 Tax=Ekhidna sp. TaxID=2608089 RepID=UPI003B511857